MHEQMIKMTEGFWDEEDLELLEEIETTLQFESFSVKDAMAIARMSQWENVILFWQQVIVPFGRWSKKALPEKWMLSLMKVLSVFLPEVPIQSM